MNSSFGYMKIISINSSDQGLDVECHLVQIPRKLFFHPDSWQVSNAKNSPTRSGLWECLIFLYHIRSGFFPQHSRTAK